MTDDETPIQLFTPKSEGDRLFDAFMETLKGPAEGMHIMTILGAIRLLEDYVLSIPRNRA